MRFIGFLVGGVGLLLAGFLALVLFAPRLVPQEVYRAEIEKAASAALGRPVAVEGEIALSVFPRIAAKAGGVTLANPPGFGEAPFATVEELRASVALWPLLGRRVEVEELALVRPEIALRKRRDGVANWTFEATEGAATPSAPGAPFERKPGAFPFEAAFGDVRLVEGRATFEDAASGASHRIEGLNLRVDLPRLDSPLVLEGAFRLDDRPFTLEARLDTLKGFFEGLEAPFEAALVSDLLTARFSGAFPAGAEVRYAGRVELDAPAVADLVAFAGLDIPQARVVSAASARGRAEGDLETLRLTSARVTATGPDLALSIDGGATLGATVAYEGQVDLEVPNVRALATGLDIALPEGTGFGPFSVTGEARGGLERAQFTNAEITLDAIAARGDLTIDLARARPRIVARATSGPLDVTPYLPPQTADAARGGTGGGAPPWSEAPIDVAALRAVDADIRIDAESVTAGDFEFGRSAVTAALQDGRLQIDLTELQAYGGSGSAQVVVDARPAIPRYGLRADLANLQAQPLLAAAAKFDRLLGTGGGQLRLEGQGLSQADIMRSLSGTGTFGFADGSIAGVNLGAAAAALDQVIAGNFAAVTSAFGAGEETAFTRLAGGFRIENGVAITDDLVLDSPILRVAGSGALDIGGQSVTLRLKPALLPGAPGAGRYANIPIPLKIEGGWNGVSLGLDQAAVDELLRAAARGRIEQEATRLLDDAVPGGAGDLLRGVLGLPGAAPAAPPAEPAATPAAPAPGEAGEGAPPAAEPAPAETPPETPAEPPAPPTPEQQVENLLRGLINPGG